MAYNYYQPLFPSYYQQSNQGILWVQGLEGAKAYPVAPGASVLLMDSENSVFYIKTSNSNGVPSMQIFDYKERKEENHYVTKEELEALLASLKKEEEEDAEPSV